MDIRTAGNVECPACTDASSFPTKLVDGLPACALCRGDGEVSPDVERIFELEISVDQLRCQVLRPTAELTFDRAVLSRLPAADVAAAKADVRAWANGRAA